MYSHGDDGEDHGLRLFAVVIIVAVAMALPALWNGYPLIYFDTEDYVDISFTWQPILWRIMTYGVFCLIAQPFEHLWPIVATQSLIVAWVLHEAVSAFLPRWRGRIYILLGLLLAGLTGLPIVTSEVLADVFAGLAILGIVTLALGSPLPPIRRAVLVLLTALSVGVHMSHVAVAAGLIIVLVLLALLSLFCTWFQRPRLWSGRGAGHRLGAVYPLGSHRQSLFFRSGPCAAIGPVYPRRAGQRISGCGLPRRRPTEIMRPQGRIAANRR